MTSLSFTLDLPVGGIAGLPEPAGTSLEAADSSGGNAALIVAIAAGVAAAIALAGAAWWARRLR